MRLIKKITLLLKTFRFFTIKGGFNKHDEEKVIQKFQMARILNTKDLRELVYFYSNSYGLDWWYPSINRKVIRIRLEEIGCSILEEKDNVLEIVKAFSTNESFILRVLSSGNLKMKIEAKLKGICARMSDLDELSKLHDEIFEIKGSREAVWIASQVIHARRSLIMRTTNDLAVRMLSLSVGD